MYDALYDICIIGSGPAGMTLAAELAGSGKKICVLESGKKEKTGHADTLRETLSTGDMEIKTASRERVFGGTSTTWTGISAPMDPIDMRGWPLSLSDLEPYYRKISVYGFPEFEEFEVGRGNPQSKLCEKRFLASVPPWNFGKNLAHIFDTTNLTLITDATVVDFIKEKTLEGTKVTGVRVRASDGSEKTITAHKYVIAAGGLESPRLLLLSNLGNEHDQVGRYLMNHPKKVFGSFTYNKPTKNIAYILKPITRDWSGYLGLRIREDLQKSLDVLNSYVRFEPVFSFHQKVLRKLFPSVNLAARKMRVWNFMEMEPRAENRLTLGEKPDKNGKLLPVIHMTISERERRSVIELHRVLADEMKKNGIGKLESNLEAVQPWPITFDASHHIGGAIMGNDPKTSVVDKNLKVHSVDNLYVASSAVFPTSGNANPTYTICALAARLAKHLAS